MRHLIASLSTAASMLLVAMGVTFAASTGTTGQPSQSCEDLSAGLPPGSLRPGNSFSSQGTFNPDGTASAHYAGQPGTPTDPNSPGTHASANAVSQYDVACFQQSQKQVP